MRDFPKWGLFCTYETFIKNCRQRIRDKKWTRQYLFNFCLDSTLHWYFEMNGSVLNQTISLQLLFGFNSSLIIEMNGSVCSTLLRIGWINHSWNGPALAVFYPSTYWDCLPSFGLPKSAQCSGHNSSDQLLLLPSVRSPPVGQAKALLGPGPQPQTRSASGMKWSRPTLPPLSSPAPSFPSGGQPPSPWRLLDDKSMSGGHLSPRQKHPLYFTLWAKKMKSHQFPFVRWAFFKLSHHQDTITNKKTAQAFS